MLEKIRKFAHNPIFKVIFGVLIIAFAISGLSGLALNSGSDNYIAKVGTKKITSNEIEKKFGQLLRSFGPSVLQLKEEQLQQLGISRDVVLKTIIQGSLVNEEVEDIGIVISEKSIKEQIKKTPVFYDESKQFSVKKFDAFLQKMDITEASLKKDIQRDLQNLMLASSVLNSAPKNLLVAEAVADAINAKRELEIIKIPANRATIIAEPSAEDLQKFYFENSAKFRSSETRDISIINIPKPADEDKTAYDKITKISDDLAGGATLDEVAEKHKLAIELRPNVGVDGSKLSQLVFNLKQKQVSTLSENEDGSYSIVQVDNIHASELPDIATVKPQVLALYKAEKTKIEAIKFAQDVLVEVKSGKSMQQVAADKQVTYVSSPLFSSDDNSYGQEFIMSVFNTPSGEIAGVIPAPDNGFLIAKVKKIVPSDITEHDIVDAMEKGQEVFQQEVFQQYMSYLENKHKIVIKEPKQEKQQAEPAKKS